MLIVDGHVVDPATGLHEIADVLIEQDCIKKIYVRSRGEQADYNEAQENGHLVIDAKDKCRGLLICMYIFVIRD